MSSEYYSYHYNRISMNQYLYSNKEVLLKMRASRNFILNWENDVQINSLLPIVNLLQNYTDITISMDYMHWLSTFTSAIHTKVDN